MSWWIRDDGYYNSPPDSDAPYNTGVVDQAPYPIRSPVPVPPTPPTPPTPPGPSGYIGLSGTALFRSPDVQAVAFATTGFGPPDENDISTASQLWALNTAPQSINQTITGAKGLAIDSRSNTFYTSGFIDDSGDAGLFPACISSSVMNGLDSTLSGAFAPPATIQYAGYSYTSSSDEYDQLVASDDGAFLYAIFSDATHAYVVVVKIDTASGLIAATSATFGAHTDTFVNLLLSTDGTQIYVAPRSLESTSMYLPGLIVLDAGTLSTIHSADYGLAWVATATNGNMKISTDGTKLACISRDASPNAYYALIFDVATLTTTTFLLSTTGHSLPITGDMGINSICFPQNDAAHVYVIMNDAINEEGRYLATNTRINKYALDGTLVSSQPVNQSGPLGAGGGYIVECDPNTGLLVYSFLKSFVYDDADGDGFAYIDPATGDMSDAIPTDTLSGGHIPRVIKFAKPVTP